MCSKPTTMDLCLGFFFMSCSVASPVVNCGSGWSFGHHISGTGCLRKLNNQFNQKTCLLNGFHLTLTEVPWGDVRRKDIYCVKDENIIPQVQQTTTTNILNGLDGDLKDGVKSDIEEQSKEGIVKALGCCLEGLQPSG